MIPSAAPSAWFDRSLVKAALDANRTFSPVGLRDEVLTSGMRKLTVVGIDPGGTTGWSVLKVDGFKLLDQAIPVHQAVTKWTNGQMDCGSTSGNAGDSATANDLDLGISETGEAAGVWMLEQIINNVTELPGTTAVVIEDFILRTNNKSRDALSPVRITAALQQLLWEGQYATVYKQQPSEGKTALTDERLKKRGFYTGSNSDRHARDADRHALLFLQKCRQKPGRMREAFPLVAEAAKRRVI